MTSANVTNDNSQIALNLSGVTVPALGVDEFPEILLNVTFDPASRHTIEVNVNSPSFEAPKPIGWDDNNNQYAALSDNHGVSSSNSVLNSGATTFSGDGSSQLHYFAPNQS